MTNTFNKGIKSPILEEGQGYIFHAAGGDFKITGSHIETVAETNETFRTLVAAGKIFDINEAGISFYYDYNAKSPVTKIQEGSPHTSGEIYGKNKYICFSGWTPVGAIKSIEKQDGMRLLNEHN